MAEAGPSNPNGALSTLFPSTQASPTRRPAVRLSSADPLSSSVEENAPTNVGTSQRPPSILRKSPMSATDLPSARSTDPRRRVLSLDAAFVDSPHAQEPDGDALGPSSNRPSTSPRFKQARNFTTAPLSEGTAGVPMLTAFSDEYDLSHEDPRILEDVQRALKLKARREARLKGKQSRASKAAPPELNFDIPAPLNFTSPAGQGSEHPSVGASEDQSLESEVDFSPSVGTIPLHPVPSSSNGGATLDWTGSTSEEDKSDKKWTLSVTKRRHKSKHSHSTSRTVVEKQDSLYADKISRIKSRAKPHTMRKVSITADQLERRYRTLMTVPRTAQKQGPINILAVARWYNQLDATTRATLDRAEPLTWLKHILDKPNRAIRRSQWFLSALVIEEYYKAHFGPQTMDTIPEDEIAPKSSPATLSYPETTKSPSSGSWSWTPPRQSLEPSFARKHMSYDAQVSFEPTVESGRGSIDGDMRPGNDGFIRRWRHSLPAGADSASGSIHSMINSTSPTSSRLHLRDFARRIRRKANGSDDALSSARNSLSERSLSEDDHIRLYRSRSRKGPPSSPMRSRDGTDADEEAPLVMPVLDFHGSETIRPPAQHQSPDDTALPTSMSVTTPRPIAFPENQVRISLPSTSRAGMKVRDAQEDPVDEEQLRKEYERKSQFLEDARYQNQRMRQILQRVGLSMKEFDATQTSLSEALEIPFEKIPSDVLDAFNHDPAAVTNSTRRLNGWQAVEDIHSRVQRQQDILRQFIDSLGDEDGILPISGSVFRDPIDSLANSLKDLEAHRNLLTSQAERTMETLTKVKQVHTLTKKEYKDTMSHTSLVYPELSQIAALEESYRNHYQQLWDIGLDALTLLLDTVTPFWRNYGKVIGEDVQDFLIIPWYRNEFTGEPKRYPIKNFPRRSLRHWVGIVCLYLLTFGVTTLQIRAAIVSTLHCHLPFISHSGLWWICFPLYLVVLLVQWCAVLFECCILLAQWGVVIWWMGWTVRIVN
ncbi:hypothetical protein CERSUDRAFT_110441 [Gelatoporia subvermispora B]|uniref:Uncharacterized protein n=1 Tax=Ceriporiopsis subvermispora (strain B) TaxID=914234 RepID=M2PYB9_CERS8|nr:hypothetical protein CERSUDRAFT_110441 [Gelatoporia subvermispora B]